MDDDRRLDPVTEDFLAAPKGAFASCDSIENAIAFSYLIPLGSWEGDPLLGHRFNEILTDTQEDRNRLADYAQQAVQWLIHAGRLDHVDVFVESLGAGSVAFEVDYYLPNTPKPKRLGFLVPVGAG